MPRKRKPDVRKTTKGKNRNFRTIMGSNHN